MCPIGFLMLGSTLQTCRAIRPPHADQPTAGGEPCRAPAPPTNDPHVHPAYPGRPRGRAGHCPTTSRRRRPGPNRRLRWPSTACASFEDEAPTQADNEPGMDPAGDHADPGHPSHTAACPTAALQDLTSAGHSGRGNAQTPDADTGRRTVDTWTLRRPHRTLDSGPVDRQAWTLVARTGHRTLDTGRWPRTRTG